MRALGYHWLKKSAKETIGISKDIRKADALQFRYPPPSPIVIRHSKKKRTPAKILLIEPLKSFNPMMTLMRLSQQPLPLTAISMMSLAKPPIRLLVKP